MRPTCVILTATVQPHALTPQLIVSDPEERLKEYSRAIEEWGVSAAQHGIPVFVMENSASAARLSRLPAVGSGKVQVISVTASEPSTTYRGKGLGEAELLLAGAEIAQQFDTIIKCTGRLFVRNWVNLLERVHRFDRTRIVADIDLHFRRADTRFFFVEPPALRELAVHALARVDESLGVDFETATAEWMIGALARGESAAQLPRSPVIVGRSASMNEPYHGRRAMVRSTMENVLQVRMQRSPNH